jgi:dienelactone hydrolase
MTTKWMLPISVVVFFLLSPREATWAAPRVLPEGQVPKDARLQPLKDLDGYFPFTPPTSPGDWSQRAETVRRQLLVALGLWPMPSRSPLNPVIHGRIDRDDYTVEKVYFESVPGFFVTGSLYRPKGKTGKYPGVLCPHGHWNNGRFVDFGEDGVKKEIVQGAERFDEGGRSPLQSRCVQLARMGCVVFHYDMLGYADSVQIPMEIAHGFKKQRPEMNTIENWGLFSPQAEMHLQSVMGLQTWNSIRALDFLLQLPDVDGERIGCTGASGGGTQTFILGALDPRVKVAFPAVMVSTAMQGGCTCENASLLRVDTGNIEFAAMFAPKPLGMTSANDWTKEMAAKGFPELKKIYGLLGAPENVSLKRGEHFDHNYNYVSRAAMYSWMNKHLKLGLKEPIVEPDYRRLTQQEMSVWDAQHPAPKAGDLDWERRLLRHLHDDAQRQLAAERSAPAEFRKMYGGAVEAIVGRTARDTGTSEWEMAQKEEKDSWLEMRGLIRNRTHQEELPAVFFHPKNWNGTTVLWLSGEGKAALYADGGALKPELQKLLAAGVTVAGVDLFQQGEFRSDGQPLLKTGRVKNPREAAAYTFGYNHTVFAQRAHDVLTVAQFIKTNERPSKRLFAVGVNGAGPILAAARAVAEGTFDGALLDTGGFRFGKLLEIHDPNFLPGGAKYGDVPALLALGAPGKLWVAGESREGLSLTAEQYRAAGAEKSLTLLADSGQKTILDALMSEVK